MTQHRIERLAGMVVEWDVPIEMDDGTVLRCDIFRPDDDGRHPAIMAMGPYGKLVHFSDGYPHQWSWITQQRPEVLGGSSNAYQNFEVCDPEKFVPDGFACVRVDSRGAGRSPGYLDPWCAREAQDLYDCIEWCATLPWCNGRIGLSGTSYLAMNQWQVAALQPPSLAAICVWEGALDYYRDMAWHGGILCTFSKTWYGPVVLPVQHGVGEKGYKSSMNGEWVAGPVTLTAEELEANRTDWHAECSANKLATDEFWTSRRPDISAVTTPLLSTANWGGQGLHLRGNVEGFLDAASEHKWLDFHTLDHWTEYYTDYGVDLQKRFFGYFLKEEDNGWADQPRVHLQVRRPDTADFDWRDENEWPLARTRWTTWYLDAETAGLSTEPPTAAATVSYRGLSDGVTFVTPPLAQETELTGPMAARLYVSSDTEDADLFLVLRVFAPDFREIVFPGHIDPNTPIAQGWLRASHRKLDEGRSLPYRPFHSHDEIQKLTPGRIYALDVEILPSCVAIPEGYRVGLTVRGRDYVAPGIGHNREIAHLGDLTGCGLFRHDDPDDRPAAVFDGTVTLATGPENRAFLLLPVIPPK
ncbi:MAG: CocE/NonD family hydrolase [Defluviicoccus sp.]|nr:CocE/NonD family hydrolase [Defluviicoccus sp.]MDE0385771.1 CocE/NonD family hydrolase [Defluviicoccus sp.]